jgi:rubrerythrin
MKKMTEGNLWAAFAGESQAHMKYLAFSAKADEEGLPNIARMFKAIAFAEQIHATNHLRQLSGIGTTGQNVVTALGGETFEIDSMYPAYAVVAKLEDEKGASLSIRYAYEAEKIHKDMYAATGPKADAKQDISMGKIFICPVCGHTVEGAAPDKCPICATAAAKFVSF